jgi:hypothetical protein
VSVAPATVERCVSGAVTSPAYERASPAAVRFDADRLIASRERKPSGNQEIDVACRDL